ncbi:uncharacterized protein LOC119721312 [Patiria miniata]|uniref:Uncharacterized protein n=1 Tax=Patiria miniata TaxID=46514 RepID=A0A913Z6B9_PATMI|nr:uncharacterized protein LOC119721312 [Patiria miniata]
MYYRMQPPLAIDQSIHMWVDLVVLRHFYYPTFYSLYRQRARFTFVYICSEKKPRLQRRKISTLYKMNRQRHMSRRRLFRLAELVAELEDSYEDQGQPGPSTMCTNPTLRDTLDSSSTSVDTGRDSSDAESAISERIGTSGETSANNSELSEETDSKITLRKLYLQNKQLEAQLQKQSKELQAMGRRLETSGVKSKGRRVIAPLQCSHAVREVYGELFKDGDDGFNFYDMKSSAENEGVISQFIHKVQSTHGRERWTTEQIKKACKTYFTSLKDKQRRQEQGTYKQHTDDARKRSRKYRKLQRRQSSLRAIDLPDAKRKEAEEVLTLAYMSSEESMTEEEEEEDGGGDQRRKVRRLRKLPWERYRLTALKNKLDTHFVRTASTLVSRMLPEFVSGLPSTRPPPADAPSWAIRPASSNS